MAVNTNTFSGRFNRLQKEETYQAIFNCQYDMFWYPFDTQICFMDIVTSHSLDKFLQLQPVKLDYVGNGVVFSQYKVLATRFCSASIGGKVGIKVEVLMQRGLFSSVLTIFLPTILINVIGIRQFL